MKLKEINRTSTIAWSPIQSCQAIATGTVAGALDESFSNTTELEIFKLDWAQNEAELKPSGVVTSNARFNRLAWAQPTGDFNLGVIAGGMENGEIDFWNPEKILAGASSEESLISRQANHTGSVRGLEFNPFQSNLLASGASNGEVFIWNLGDLTKPYSPGPKSQKLEDITSLSWNRKVQHILATSSTSGYTVVWDLKNRREVMSLGYQPSGNMNFGGMTGPRGVTAVAWNPDSATQLVTASEDDNNPVIMLWDLRNANAPEKVFTGHTKGVLSLGWCPMDSDLLLSCGKDNRNICWNPKSGDILGEFPQSRNWSFDIQWSPRNPNLFTSSSYDGKVAVYSILSSGEENTEVPKEANDDPFNPVQPTPAASFSLKQPPKWFRRPVGATFGFGGQLIHFGSSQGNTSHKVTITNVISDSNLIERTDQLQAALETGPVDEFLSKKASKQKEEQFSWDILSLLFKEDSRDQLLKMLGVERNISQEEISMVLKSLGINEEQQPEEPQAIETNGKPEPSEESPGLENKEANPPDEFSNLFQGEQEEKKDDDFFSKAPNTESELKLSESKVSSSFVPNPFKIAASSNDLEGLLSKMVVVSDFKGAVNVCLKAGKYADALLMAIAGGSDLLESTKHEIFKLRKGESSYIRILQSVSTGNFEDIVLNADLEEWDRVLTLICTYAQGEEFSHLIESLGLRLSQATDKPEHRQNALLCFLIAGNVEKVVNIWVSEHLDRQRVINETTATEQNQQAPTSEHMFFNNNVLQDLVEKVALFCKAVDFVDPASQVTYETEENQVQINSRLSVLYNLYYEYALFLTSQGRLDIAAKYLGQIPSSYKRPSGNSLDDYAALKYRLYYSGVNVEAYDPNVFPFTYEEIGGSQYQEEDSYQQPEQNQTESYNQYDSQFQPQTQAQQQYQPPAQQQYQPPVQQQYQAPVQQQDSAQTSYYGETYPQYPQQSQQSQHYPIQSSMPVPNSDPHQAAANVYDPYSNFSSGPPMVPSFPSATQPPQESVAPPSAQRNVPAWNDPPTQVFSKKNANKPSPKASVLTSPFGAPSPASSMPPSNQPPQAYGQSASLPPPPQGGRAPAPLYNRKANSPKPQTAQSSQPQGFAPNLNPGFQHAQSQGPPQGHGPPHGMPQPRGQHPQGIPQPHDQHKPQQQAQAQPPRPAQPPQRPLYQTNPAQPAPPSLSAQRIPGPPTPHPARGPAPGQALGVGQVQQPPRVTPPKPQNAAIDRTKMPAKYKPLFEQLNKILTTIKTQGVPPPQQRMLADVERRFGQMFDAMNQDQLAPSLLEPLTAYGKAIDAKDYNQALKVQSELVSTQVSQVGAWVAGLKHLVSILRTRQ